MGKKFFFCCVYIRCWRNGQPRPVTVYHLVSHGTKEEEQLIHNKHKEGMDSFMVRQNVFVKTIIDKKFKTLGL